MRPALGRERRCFASPLAGQQAQQDRPLNGSNADDHWGKLFLYAENAADEKVSIG